MKSNNDANSISDNGMIHDLEIAEQLMEIPQMLSYEHFKRLQEEYLSASNKTGKGKPTADAALISNVDSDLGKLRDLIEKLRKDDSDVATDAVVQLWEAAQYIETSREAACAMLNLGDNSKVLDFLEYAYRQAENKHSEKLKLIGKKMIVEMWKSGEVVGLIEPPLAAGLEQIHQIIVEASKKAGGIQGNEILNKLAADGDRFITEGTLTKSYIPQLKEKRGLKTGAKGYYYPSSLVLSQV